MTESLRSCWRNCAKTADPEILAIDKTEDELAPLDADIVRVRELISTLELCHHKAERWVENIVEAIGTGSTARGLGTRPGGEPHPVESVWQNACETLSAWCAGDPLPDPDLPIGTVPAARLLAGLGQREPLKQWQVQRVVEKIRSFIDWPRSLEDPALRYTPLLLAGGEYECVYLNECPESYRADENFWRQTARTLIHDTDSGHAAEISLALAIDMLMPCHWRFVENLRIVLDAIGGSLHPDQPFAACGRNISLVPLRAPIKSVCATLKVFQGEFTQNHEADKNLLELLGKATPTKRWLAASLDKTIRLQLDPPQDLRELSALAGPDWIHR